MRLCVCEPEFRFNYKVSMSVVFLSKQTDWTSEESHCSLLNYHIVCFIRCASASVLWIRHKQYERSESKVRMFINIIHSWRIRPSGMWCCGIGLVVLMFLKNHRTLFLRGAGETFWVSVRKLSINFEEILSHAYGNFEEKNKVLSFSLSVALLPVLNIIYRKVSSWNEIQKNVKVTGAASGFGGLGLACFL